MKNTNIVLFSEDFRSLATFFFFFYVWFGFRSNGCGAVTRAAVVAIDSVTKRCGSGGIDGALLLSQGWPTSWLLVIKSFYSLFYCS